ncbi:hypothetical protein V8B97DRAFT_1946262 [Scleroderma yunnanense]
MLLLSSSLSSCSRSNLVDVSTMLLSGDHSLTHNPDAACGSADNCILTIPFTGEYTLAVLGGRSDPDHRTL